LNTMSAISINDCKQPALSSIESKMTELISQRLEQQNLHFSSANKISASGNDSAAFLAERLSRLLAKASHPSTGSESDSKAFEQSVRRLQCTLQKRRAAKVASAQRLGQNSQDSRRQVLIATLGADQAQKVISLIREIRVLRLRRRDLLGPAALESHQPMVCERGGCSANVYSVQHGSDGKLPQEVRDFFFRTAIVDALEKSSLERLAELPWDQLYAQGRKHVQAYRSWLARQTSSE